MGCLGRVQHGRVRGPRPVRGETVSGGLHTIRLALIVGPGIFLAASIGYGYLPAALGAAMGDLGLVYATACAVVALTASSVVQPFARRRVSATGPGGIVMAGVVLVAALLLCLLAVAARSPIIGLLANVVVGAGMGLGLLAGLSMVQRVAASDDLATLTGVFYAVAYIGFFAPAVIAALATVGVAAVWSIAAMVGVGGTAVGVAVSWGVRRA